MQCFANRTKLALVDDREDHQSEPPTRWFIAETDFGRKLKIAYIPRGQDVYLRSAFPAAPKWIAIYEDYHK